ncbi:MAG: hypothetical protein GY749_04630 [Desulfobacteraceae bacterium]|nr:hypothetical protein [Desulfobacteraceae bacterium]
MSDSEKVFKTTCPECKKTFHLRRSPVSPDAERTGKVKSECSPDAEGTGEVKTECFHCNAEVMITVPRPYIEKGPLTFQEDE